MIFRLAFLAFLYFSLQVAYDAFVVTPVPATVESHFYKEVKNFYKFASYQKLGEKEKERFKTLTVKFGPVENISPPHKLSGVCHYEHNEIWIEESAWEKMSPLWRQNLIDHEIGHCVLGRIHRHAVNSDGDPESIMTPFLTKNPTIDWFGNDIRRHELFDSNLFHKLPELLSSMKNFKETYKDLLPFMMADSYDIALAFEDVLNEDAPKETQRQRLDSITSQAKEVETSWKEVVAQAEKSSKDRHLSIFEREQRISEIYMKKLQENSGL